MVNSAIFTKMFSGISSVVISTVKPMMPPPSLLRLYHTAAGMSIDRPQTKRAEADRPRARLRKMLISAR